MRQTVGILGTPIDILDTEEVLRRLQQFIEEGRFHQVATANTDFLINGLSDPELRHILRNADLVVPDGMPVVWAARLVRSRLPERVTGADIVPALAALAARKGYRIFMLGARPEVAQKAKERMEAQNPGLQIVGCLSPPPAPIVSMNHEAILQEIARARPDILLVAFGNPKQEKWIHMHRDRLRDVPICIGVGGTFDFLAGETQRAPAWMQKSGLEWVHRLAHEPRRLWKRYVRDITHFTRYLVRQWWGLWRNPGTGHSDLFVAQTGDCTILSIKGDFNASLLPGFQAAAERAINERTHIILDLYGVATFDGEALGTLLNLPKRAAYFNCDVRLVCVPPAIAKALRRSHVHEGLYKVVDSVAEALTNGRSAGLCWHIRSGAGASVILVSGVSERHSVLQLEQTCIEIMETGKRLDMDARELGYADMALLSVLTRIAACGKERFRLIPGEVLRQALVREKLLDKFVLCDVPEMPADAVIEISSLSETVSETEDKMPVGMPGSRV